MKKIIKHLGALLIILILSKAFNACFILQIIISILYYSVWDIINFKLKNFKKWKI